MVVAMASGCDWTGCPSQNGRTVVETKTPPAGTARRSKNMSRSTSLRGRARERAMTATKERLTGPM